MFCLSNDVLAVNEAGARAIGRARRGEGPTILELKTYRIGGHSRNDACGYRPNEEEKAWFSKDPVRTFRERLIDERVITEEELEKIEKEITDEIDAEVEYAKNSKDPEPESALRDVYWEGGTR